MSCRSSMAKYSFAKRWRFSALLWRPSLHRPASMPYVPPHRRNQVPAPAAGAESQGKSLSDLVDRPPPLQQREPLRAGGGGAGGGLDSRGPPRHGGGADLSRSALRAPPPDKDYSVDRGRDLSVDRLAEATGYKYNPKGAPSRFGSAGRNPHRPLGEGEDVPGGVRGEGYS